MQQKTGMPICFVCKSSYLTKSVLKNYAKNISTPAAKDELVLIYL